MRQVFASVRLRLTAHIWRRSELYKAVATVFMFLLIVFVGILQFSDCFDEADDGETAPV